MVMFQLKFLQISNLKIRLETVPYCINLEIFCGLGVSDISTLYYELITLIHYEFIIEGWWQINYRIFQISIVPS